MKTLSQGIRWPNFKEPIKWDSLHHAALHTVDIPIQPLEDAAATRDTAVVLLSMMMRCSVGGEPHEVHCHLQTLSSSMSFLPLQETSVSTSQLCVDSPLSDEAHDCFVIFKLKQTSVLSCSRSCRGRRAEGRAHIPEGCQCCLC